MLQRHNARRAKKSNEGVQNPAAGLAAGLAGIAPMPGSLAAQQAANLAAFTAMQAAGMGEEFLRSMLQPMM